MKTSWIIGTITWWIVLFLNSGIITTVQMFDGTQTSKLQELMTPVTTDFSNVFTGFITVMSNIGHYMKVFIQVTFLWFPDIWSGVWLWVWYISVVPLAIGMIFTIVTIIRGVGSN